VCVCVCVCTTAFDTKTHTAHTFRLCVPCHAHKSSDYFSTPIGVYNGSTLVFCVGCELYVYLCV